MPVVTVVIPTRDRAGMLSQALASVLAQEVDLEVIVVDEASTDATATFLAGVDDARLRVITNPAPVGLPRARNAAIEQAQGEVVAFLDDDDLWFPGKLRSQLDAMAVEGADWSYGGAIIFSEGPRLESVILAPAPDLAVAQLPYRNMVPGGGSNAIVSRMALERVGPFALDLPSIEDWDLWIRLSLLGPPATTEAIGTAYRRHGGNMSRAVARTLASSAELESRTFPLRDGRPIDWADLLHWTSSDALRAGDRRMARRIALKSLRGRHPGSFKRLLQSASPWPRRPPIPEPREPINLYERIRPPRVVPWPPGMDTELRRMLAQSTER